MSRDGPIKGRGKLPLPSPGSPADLDDKLLALARTNAPARHRNLGWAGGLATAAVLVVAVYLTNLGDSTLTTPAPTEPAVLEQAHTANTASAKAAPVAELRVQAKARSTMPEDFQIEADRAIAEATPLPRDTRAGETFAAAAAMSPQADEVAAEASDSTLATEERLRDIQELVASGKHELAQEKYAQLLLDCVDCDLPEELDKALEALPQDPQ